MDSDANAYLTKPFSTRDLLNWAEILLGSATGDRLHGSHPP
jgi:DNA-binding response OmpR family regulator